VRGILSGGDTAATEFFRRKTSYKLTTAFKPVVSEKVNQVGATKAYKDMMGRYEKVPLMGGQSLDLDDYVTRKSLDGLFFMVGQEEKKIRTNPAARTTDLLKQVFGKSRAANAVRAGLRRGGPRPRRRRCRPPAGRGCSRSSRG
jgi:hypothetical protein